MKRKEAILLAVADAYDKLMSNDINSVVGELDMLIGQDTMRKQMAENEYTLARQAFRALVESEIAKVLPILNKYTIQWGWANPADLRSNYFIKLYKEKHLFIGANVFEDFHKELKYRTSTFIGLKFSGTGAEAFGGSFDASRFTFAQMLERAILDSRYIQLPPHLQ